MIEAMTVPTAEHQDVQSWTEDLFLFDPQKADALGKALDLDAPYFRRESSRSQLPRIEGEN
jgi:hypothetical protein